MNMEKVLCFELRGFILGVDSSQVEKVLVNKNPSRESFTLATGVEIKPLWEYIPLPERAEKISENIIFIKDQKDSYGFTVDRVRGYVNVRASERQHQKMEQGPIRYYIKIDGDLIPVLDLAFITNNKGSVGEEHIKEIVEMSRGISQDGGEVEEEPSLTVSKEEVFRSIEEEIKRSKKDFSETVIKSERKGFLFPVLINAGIVLLFGAGLLYFIMTNRESLSMAYMGGVVTGVEEEVIKEIKRRSEEELSQQRKKLEEAKRRLEALRREKEFFEKNQDKILAEKEKKLREEYNRKLEEIRKRLEASGVANVEEAFQAEKQKLYQEYLASLQATRSEIEKVKRQYEEALKQKEAEIKKEVNIYSRRLAEMEAQLESEQSKLRKVEEQFKSVAAKQKEYEAFRNQLNLIYDRALKYLEKGNTSRGLETLRNAISILNEAEKRGLTDPFGLSVEKELINRMIYITERERAKVDVNELARKTLLSANTLEAAGKEREALYKYFTVYTIAKDQNLRERAYKKAQDIMNRIYAEISSEEKARLESEASDLIKKAGKMIDSGDYDRAVELLYASLSTLTDPAIAKDVLNKIAYIKEMKLEEEQQRAVQEREKNASVLMAKADELYKKGFFSEAIDYYREIATNFSGTRSADIAIDRLISISEKMKEYKVASRGRIEVTGKDTSVVIQKLGTSQVIIGLGGNDGVKSGDTLQVYRKIGSEFQFVCTLRVFEVYPTSSKASVTYFERSVKVGDIVTY